MRAGLLMCVLRQDRQRDKHEVRRRDAAVYGVLVLETFIWRGIDFLIVDPPPRLPTKQAQGTMLSGCSRRCVSYWDVVPPLGFLKS